MLAYHRGTWRDGDGLPDVAALDVFMQRYGWDYWTYLDQPTDVLEELGMVIQAESTARREDAERQADELDAARRRQGLSPLSRRRRSARGGEPVSLTVVPDGLTDEQRHAQMYHVLMAE